ncbi:hypothetical protein PF005_g27275 [Phytophthora fragariae]|uniref:RxLR effector protein n=1 Tax=Phytophthora fragariae TaxID=53985 RepID=A0A6A3PXX6_9STRA|nr:hypothetical protein PF009_g29735 [Phytophthora fragariae]KAE8965223.1 hypothetical protein PF011_g28378 [Phytophthora fragariae]KAE9063646.1 hypothetical protein PF010_g28915 [Phytophthora fragariae]KAE9064483.1 hypothetical protein PF007_g29184 [Phytophthora fragariae]KAE9072088.1 hypothetical protein PF006_g29004 [Phytophthora fragariae]
MRLSITLLFIATAGLFATGHAATDLDQTKISQSQPLVMAKDFCDRSLQ